MGDAVRVLVGVLPERSGTPCADVLFDLITIAQRGHPFIRTQYARTELQRNMMAEHLLKTDYTHLLMLDVDHRHPPDIVERLSRWVKQDPARLIVAGLAFRRCAPYDPCVFLVNEQTGAIEQPAEWAPGLVQADLVGTAAILIHRSVFERVARPWFAMDFSGAAAGKYPGEDMWFCQRAREAGIGVWCDLSTVSPHLIERWVDAGTFQSYRAQQADVQRPLSEADLVG